VVLSAILLIVPLGLDTFGVAAALGMAGLPARSRLRLSLVFAGFEAAMPLVGIALGAPLGNTIGGAADYIAAAVVGALGVTALVTARSGKEPEVGNALLARTRGAALIGLGVSVSLDELAIGLAIGLLRVPLAGFLAAVAVQAFVVTQIGLRLGARLGERLRERAEYAAGLALIGIAALLIVERLTS
jgi:putative Mn2+ efflux pump MntP